MSDEIMSRMLLRAICHKWDAIYGPTKEIQNMNHGHVTPNPDGSLARCGGPGLCQTCAGELMAAENRAHAQQIAPDDLWRPSDADGQLERPQQQLNHQKTSHYEVQVRCNNCGYRGQARVIKGSLITCKPCPDCECNALLLDQRVSHQSKA